MSADHQALIKEAEELLATWPARWRTEEVQRVLRGLVRQSERLALIYQAATDKTLTDFQVRVIAGSVARESQLTEADIQRTRELIAEGKLPADGVQYVAEHWPCSFGHVHRSRVESVECSDEVTGGGTTAGCATKAEKDSSSSSSVLPAASPSDMPDAESDYWAHGSPERVEQAKPDIVCSACGAGYYFGLNNGRCRQCGHDLTGKPAASPEGRGAPTRVWCCRFHPTDWFHEVGCPHMEWSEEQLKAAKGRAPEEDQ